MSPPKKAPASAPAGWLESPSPVLPPVPMVPLPIMPMTFDEAAQLTQIVVDEVTAASTGLDALAAIIVGNLLVCSPSRADREVVKSLWREAYRHAEVGLEVRAALRAEAMAAKETA